MYYIEDDRSAIKSLQKKLAVIYPEKMVIHNGIYDDKTKDAVYEIQRTHGLTENGITDFLTFNAIRELSERLSKKARINSKNPTIPFPIGVGYVSDTMTEINMMLGVMLEYYGEINRIRYNRVFSEATRDAVRVLRIIYLLPPDDYIDEIFLDLLLSDYNYIVSYSDIYPV